MSKQADIQALRLRAQAARKGRFVPTPEAYAADVEWLVLECKRLRLLLKLVGVDPDSGGAAEVQIVPG